MDFSAGGEDVLVMIPIGMNNVNVPRARVRRDQIPRQQTAEAYLVIAIAGAFRLRHLERLGPAWIPQDTVRAVLETAESRKSAVAPLGALRRTFSNSPSSRYRSSSTLSASAINGDAAHPSFKIDVQNGIARMEKARG